MAQYSSIVQVQQDAAGKHSYKDISAVRPCLLASSHSACLFCCTMAAVDCSTSQLDSKASTGWYACI